VATVEAISTVDLTTNIQRRLSDCERRVFRKHKDRILLAVKTAWTGWLYIGRPAGAQQNVSFKEWYGTIESTVGDKVVLRIFNAADYSSFVHRSGSTVIEWQRIWAEVEAAYIPPLAADLRAEIIKNLSAPVNPKKLGPKGGGTTIRREAISL
jgi:hypothetical protein